MQLVEHKMATSCASVTNKLTSEGIDTPPRPEGMDLDGSRRNSDHSETQATLNTHVGTVVKNLGGGGELLGRGQLLGRAIRLHRDDSLKA